MNKKTNKFKDYDAPRIKVVSFKVEHGFAGSPNFENRTVGNNLSTEEVTESDNSLTDIFFPRN